jgi:hypothetical protein
MLKIYCTECGNPTNYSVSKPKFCSNCGSSFEKTIINKIKPEQPSFNKIQPSKKVIARNEEDPDYEEDESEEINYVPDIRKLDCDIMESKKQNLKIKDVIGTADPIDKSQRNKTKKLSKIERKKFLEEFQKEAGSLRPKSRGRKDG